MFSFRLSSPLGARSDDELITLQEARAFFKGQNRSIEEDLKSSNAKAAGIAENKYRILESSVFIAVLKSFVPVTDRIGG